MRGAKLMKYPVKLTAECDATLGRQPSHSGAKQITVGIPAYNSGSFIRKTLASVMSQKALPATVLVSDNASNDDTRQVVSEFESIRLLTNEKNIGSIENHNRLIQIAPLGEYLWLLSSDDILVNSSVVAAVQDVLKQIDVVPDMITLGRVGVKAETGPAYMLERGDEYLRNVLLLRREFRLIPSLVIFKNDRIPIVQTNERGYTDDTEYFFNKLLRTTWVLHMCGEHVIYTLRTDSDTALTPNKTKFGVHYSWLEKWLLSEALKISLKDRHIAMARFVARRRSEVDGFLNTVKIFPRRAFPYVVLSEIYRTLFQTSRKK